MKQSEPATRTLFEIIQLQPILRERKMLVRERKMLVWAFQIPLANY